MICELCKKPIYNVVFSHNGEPLVNGRVCNDCNWKVIRERMRLAKGNESKEQKPTFEDGENVFGSDTLINIEEQIINFEKHAREFGDLFILDKTPNIEDYKNYINQEIIEKLLNNIYDLFVLITGYCKEQFDV